ncbi:MAG: hypothetical protein JW774_04355 [Candidatus Aureabacteria bacterium]|nr:hypothetical protein [Candidatus Auribacterota bacterium]
MKKNILIPITIILIILSGKAEAAIKGPVITKENQKELGFDFSINITPLIGLTKDNIKISNSENKCFQILIDIPKKGKLKQIEFFTLSAFDETANRFLFAIKFDLMSKEKNNEEEFVPHFLSRPILISESILEICDLIITIKEGASWTYFTVKLNTYIT